MNLTVEKIRKNAAFRYLKRDLFCFWHVLMELICLSV